MGDSFDMGVGILEADLGSAFSLGALGTMNPKRQQGIPCPGFSSSQLPVGSTGGAALRFPLVAVALAGLQKAGSPLVPRSTYLFCFTRHNRIVSVFKPPGKTGAPSTPTLPGD